MEKHMHPLNRVRSVFSAMAALLPFPLVRKADEGPRRLEPFLGEPMPRPMAYFPDVPVTPMVPKRTNPKRRVQKAQRIARKITRKH